MAAGLTDRVWTIRELVEFALTAPDPSNDGPPAVTTPATRPPPVLRLVSGGKTS